MAFLNDLLGLFGKSKESSERSAKVNNKESNPHDRPSGSSERAKRPTNEDNLGTVRYPYQDLSRSRPSEEESSHGISISASYSPAKTDDLNAHSKEVVLKFLRFDERGSSAEEGGQTNAFQKKTGVIDGMVNVLLGRNKNEDTAMNAVVPKNMIKNSEEISTNKDLYDQKSKENTGLKSERLIHKTVDLTLVTTKTIPENLEVEELNHKREKSESSSHSSATETANKGAIKKTLENSGQLVQYAFEEKIQCPIETVISLENHTRKNNEQSIEQICFNLKVISENIHLFSSDALSDMLHSDLRRINDTILNYMAIMDICSSYATSNTNYNKESILEYSASSTYTPPRSLLNLASTSSLISTSTSSLKSTSTSPLKSASTSPLKSATTSPLKSASTSPLKSASTSPLKSASTSPLKSASTSPLKSASTSPLKSASTSPLKSASTSPLKSASTSPLKSASTSPLKSASTSPLKSASTSPLKSPSKISKKYELPNVPFNRPIRNPSVCLLDEEKLASLPPDVPPRLKLRDYPWVSKNPISSRGLQPELPCSENSVSSLIPFTGNVIQYPGKLPDLPGTENNNKTAPVSGNVIPSDALNTFFGDNERNSQGSYRSLDPFGCDRSNYHNTLRVRREAKEEQQLPSYSAQENTDYKAFLQEFSKNAKRAQDMLLKSQKLRSVGKPITWGPYKEVNPPGGAAHKDKSRQVKPSVGLLAEQSQKQRAILEPIHVDIPWNKEPSHDYRPNSREEEPTHEYIPSEELFKYLVAEKSNVGGNYKDQTVDLRQKQIVTDEKVRTEVADIVHVGVTEEAPALPAPRRATFSFEPPQDSGACAVTEKLPCPVCFKKFPASEIEDHAWDCQDFGDDGAYGGF